MQTYDFQSLAGHDDGRGCLAAMSWLAIDGCCCVGRFVKRFGRKLARGGNVCLQIEHSTQKMAEL